MSKFCKVIVGGHSFNGPEFFPVKVVCSENDYNLGFHYDYAQEWASAEGIDGPYFLFDSHDPAYVNCFLDWSVAPVVDGSVVRK